MDLTTRCPECGTTFSASLEQLQLRKGYIRCINCAHIFDGFEAVVSSDVTAAQSNKEPSVRKETPAPQETSAHREPSVPMPSVLRQRPVGGNEPEHHITPATPGRGPAFTISAGEAARASSSRQDHTFRLDTDNIRARPEPTVSVPRVEEVAEPVVHDMASGSAPRSSQVYVEPRNTGEQKPDDRVRSTDLVDQNAAVGSVGRLVWRLLVLLGLLVLLLQLAYVYRAQIANNVPVLRPVLERACISLECKVPYARQINQISIMSSSLRSGTGAAVGSAQAKASADEQASHTMLLQLTMRNTYDKPQEWPTLVLDLTDLSGTRVVRRNLPPDSYLPAEVLSQPFKAGSEITVSVPIILKDVKANGYQLDKFFQ